MSKVFENISHRLAALFGPQSKNGHRPTNVKGNGPNGSGVSIAPGVQFAGYEDGGQHVYLSILDDRRSYAERVTAATAYASAAYCFAAMRYRAEKVSEPPLMVVRENAETGDEEWIAKHPLASILDAPAPDMDMGELLFRSMLALDRGGQCLWVVDPAGSGIPGRLNLFGASEFEIESTRDLLRGIFRVNTSSGQKTFGPDRVILIQEPDPDNWLRGLSRVEVYLSWLNLAQSTRKAVADLLENSLWPSMVLQPDAAWNPKKDEFDEYKENVAHWGRGAKGVPLVMLGGGTASVVSSRIRDLLPSDVLDRVEATASTVFGVPSIVLQFLVGMQNSPWSQMAEARRMCYEDTIEPLWRMWEKRLTRQLLRPIDANPRILVRFDTSKVRALTADKQKQADIASKLEKIASLNERRALVGLEPVDDPAADDIPELQPPPAPILPAIPEAGNLDTETPNPLEKRGRPASPATKRRDLFAALRRDQADRQETQWIFLANRQLEKDRDHIARLARTLLADAKGDEDPVPSPASRRRFLEAVSAYLKGVSATAWRKATDQRIGADAEHVTSILTADLGFRWDLVRDGIKDYAEREAAWLVTNITETTRDRIAAVVASGIEEGLGARKLAGRIEDATAFNRERAQLIARTEATRVSNGAPVAALKALRGSQFTKTWTTAGDDRVRDEHVELEGETVGVDEKFSNGLAFPSEPNCRCILTFSEQKP